MLLEEKDYDIICAERLLEKQYLLLYLPVNDNEKLRKHADEYAKKYDLEILEISTKLKAYKQGNFICVGDAGVEDFLSAIKNANIVFTNSFHAICFSIIFNVQFYAFSRAFAGKVRDICEVFELTDRFFPDDDFVEKHPIDFEQINKTHNELKCKSAAWLRKSIESVFS
jgi:hypothetical protein